MHVSVDPLHQINRSDHKDDPSRPELKTLVIDWGKGEDAIRSYAGDGGDQVSTTKFRMPHLPSFVLSAQVDFSQQ